MPVVLVSATLARRYWNVAAAVALAAAGLLSAIVAALPIRRVDPIEALKAE